MRIKIFHIIIAILFCILLVSLVYMQLIRGNFYYRLSEGNRIRLISQQAKRGIIFDRNGVVIAGNKISFDVMAIPQDIDDIDSSLTVLSRFLQKGRIELLRKFALGRTLPFFPVTLARNISREEAIIIEENKDQLAGIEVQVNAKRFYPLAESGSHILGYLGEIDRFRITKLKDYGYKIRDLIGYSGIEEYYDNFLRGEDGGTQVEVDSRGRQVRMLAKKEARQGRDITLTVDGRLQQIASASIGDKKGAVVFMDPFNGEILCMVSAPAFNPNAFIDRDNDALLNRYFRDQASPLLNRAVKGLYSPGSVFKIVTALAALEAKKITPVTSFLCNGSFYLGHQEFSCWEPHGLQDLRQAVVHSCNVYFYHTGLMVGPDGLSRLAKEFGLGSLVGIDLPAESRGQVPSRLQRKLSKNENWYNGDTVNFSIGQGDLLVTPLQLVRLIGQVVTGGKNVQPHLVKKIEGIETKKEIPAGHLTISKESLEKMKDYLHVAVTDESGTAHILDFAGLGIAGKTGTVQVEKGNPHAWFVGFFPYENPRYVFCVFLENGGSSYNACVVARKMFEAMLAQKIL